jgi:hypothetical protein
MNDLIEGNKYRYWNPFPRLICLSFPEKVCADITRPISLFFISEGNRKWAHPKIINIRADPKGFTPFADYYTS